MVSVTSAAPVGVRILVCGNAERGDDGAALAAIAHLLPTLPPEVCDRIEVRRCVQLDAADLIDVGPDEACVVVDAVVGIVAGTIEVCPLDALASGDAVLTARSTHGLTIRDALAQAAIVRGSVPRGSFVALGGKWFGYGERMSRVVRGALPAFADAIESEVERLLGMTA